MASWEAGPRKMRPNTELLRPTCPRDLPKLLLSFTLRQLRILARLARVTRVSKQPAIARSLEEEELGFQGGAFEFSDGEGLPAAFTDTDPLKESAGFPERSELE